MTKETEPKKPATAQQTASTFASRRAEREAAGEKPEAPQRRRSSFRAGHDAENPVLVVTNVRA